MIPIAHYFIKSYKLFFIDNEKIWEEKMEFDHSWQSRVKQLESCFLWFSFIVVEEAEVFEASKQGQEIPTPEDIPFYHDFTATADKVN